MSMVADLDRFLRGGRAAERVVDLIRSGRHVDSDALHTALRSVLGTRDELQLRAVCRHLQLQIGVTSANRKTLRSAAPKLRRCD